MINGRPWRWRYGEVGENKIAHVDNLLSLYTVSTQSYTQWPSQLQYDLVQVVVYSDIRTQQHNSPPAEDPSLKLIIKNYQTLNCQRPLVAPVCTIILINEPARSPRCLWNHSRPIGNRLWASVCAILKLGPFRQDVQNIASSPCIRHWFLDHDALTPSNRCILAEAWTWIKAQHHTGAINGVIIHANPGGSDY